MKIVCVGRNYVAHARELGNEVPTDPVIFIKPSTALLKEGAAFSIPAFAHEIHYECELVLRISARASRIAAGQGINYYDAITAGIDFTARDLQQKLKDKGLPWEKMTSSSRSESLHSQMIFDFDTLLSHISEYFTLEPGDLVFTGTPAGVGPVEPGDVLEGFVEDDSAFELSIQ